MIFGEKVLQGYIAVALVMLVIVTYKLLEGFNFSTRDGGFIMVSVLVLILIGSTLLNSIVNLKILENLRGEDELDNAPDEE